MIIRSSKPSDIDALMKLSAMLPPGMTSMPVDVKTWERKLELASLSMQDPARENCESVYFLVLEDPANGDIVGTAGLVAGVGYDRPFYNYKISKDVKASPDIDIRRTSNLLNLNNDFTGATELVSLFLIPQYRKNGMGQFLSRCRYVFMRDFPERFSDTVFAEIRGWLDENNDSPFWKHLGQKFFDLPFHKADFISAVHGSQFISDLMPRFPVYLELLPDAATAVIGKPHDDAAAAKALLEKEGFAYKGTIDIFDAGPIMECERDNIRSIKQVQALTVKTLEKGEINHRSESSCIVSNGDLSNYRLVLANASISDAGSIYLSAADADALQVDMGCTVNSLKIR